MKHTSRFAGIAAAALLFTLPAMAADFESVDQNGDGVVDGDELAAAGIDPGYLGQFDANGDGVLQPDEYAALADALGLSSD